MPEPIPPMMNPDPGYDVEAELRRAARSVIASRHRDIPADLLNDMIEYDDSIRAEYEALIDQMHQPVPNRPLPRSGWLAGGVRVFEVTESPDGKMLWHGRRYRVVNSYTMNFVPNRPRHSVYKWALNYGGQR